MTLFWNKNGRLIEISSRKPRLKLGTKIGYIDPSSQEVSLGEGGSRFGSSVANLGDLNHDGHDDIAVGAPGQDGGAGAVHIYFGRKMPLLLDNGE